MAPKRKRVSEVYQFFKQREGYFICEIENDSGSSCGGKIVVNSGCDYHDETCDALTRRNIKTCQDRRLKRVQDDTDTAKRSRTMIDKLG